MFDSLNKALGIESTHLSSGNLNQGSDFLQQQQQFFVKRNNKNNTSSGTSPVNSVQQPQLKEFEDPEFYDDI